jgi:hypothetical protein
MASISAVILSILAMAWATGKLAAQKSSKYPRNPLQQA